MTFTFIDLFSGMGGFKMALENNSGKCIRFSEINKDAINTYCENFNENQQNNLGDITKIKSLPNHDLLTAGVPCQSWSIAGKNLGFDDDRGQLWNDTLYLLQQSKPKAFIFENVKGLVDPRNKKALLYILNRIRKAGYYVKYYVINSQEYNVPQNRIRIYIIGFKEKKFLQQFKLPQAYKNTIKLANILGVKRSKPDNFSKAVQQDLFDPIIYQKSMSISNKNGFNDYFLFNDLRNGETTIHSWDILNTTKRQKDICYLLLKNRRKKLYGKLDGNPLSLQHFKNLDKNISKAELNNLVDIGIFKEEKYLFSVKKYHKNILSENEKELLKFIKSNQLVIDELKTNRLIKLKRPTIFKTLESLKLKKIIDCCEIRYDFKNTKISTGLFGVNRIFLPSSDVFPTLVASDSNDYITLEYIEPKNKEDYKKQFLEKVYKKNNYRKISKQEACLIQGFPKNFILPEARSRWMKLIGNSVSVPVIDMLCKAIIKTKVFD